MLSLLGLYWNETKSRNAEIGLMRAVGFTRMQVFGLFIKEATFISAVAIVIAQIIIINIYPEELKEPKALFVSIALKSMVVIGIVWLSVFIPAYLSTKIHPVEALSEE
jgi:ABC-type antimicrobial peptide transport system permease subunit